MAYQQLNYYKMGAGAVKHWLCKLKIISILETSLYYPISGQV